MFENFGFLFLHKIAANLNLEKVKNPYRYVARLVMM
jgi:hypothetical protein